MIDIEKIRGGMGDILRRYGNFVSGYDADGDELDIDEALRATLQFLADEGMGFAGEGFELPEEVDALRGNRDFKKGFSYGQCYYKIEVIKAGYVKFVSLKDLLDGELPTR